MRKPDNSPVRYITVLYPVRSATGHTIEGQFKETGNKDNVSINIKIDGHPYDLNYNLNEQPIYKVR